MQERESPSIASSLLLFCEMRDKKSDKRSDKKSVVKQKDDGG